MFPKCHRHHAVDVLQHVLEIAAGEEGRADTHFDMSPDFPCFDDDDYDRYCLCGDEMRDYLHLNTDRTNSAGDVADNVEIAAAADFDAAAVLFH